VKQILRRLGFGFLGALIFVAVWAGVAVLGHDAHFASWITDILLAAAGFATYVVYVRATEHRKVSELEVRGVAPELVAGFCAGILLFGIVIAILAASGHYRISRIGDPLALLRALIPWFSGAIMEELVFRGFVFRVLREIAGMPVAIALSALLFGALHAANPGATALSSVAITLEAGVLLAVAYAATNRLWLPIGIHAGWNYAEGTIFGVAVSGGVVKTTFLHGALSGVPLSPAEHSVPKRRSSPFRYASRLHWYSREE
jgi:membrane protease YdiL (CAAX protease family)